jgi:hypothetical protein
MLLCHFPPSWPWRQGGGLRWCGGFVVLPLLAGRGGKGEWRVAVRSPVSPGRGPLLWIAAALLPRSSGRSGGGPMVLVEAPPSSTGELFRSFSPAAKAACSVVPTGIKGVGHHSLCFSRRARFATADGAVTLDGDLVAI